MRVSEHQLTHQHHVCPSRALVHPRLGYLAFIDSRSPSTAPTSSSPGRKRPMGNDITTLGQNSLTFTREPGRTRLRD